MKPIQRHNGFNLVREGASNSIIVWMVSGNGTVDPEKHFALENIVIYVLTS